MWFTAINWNLNIWPNGICTTNICPGEWDIQTPLEFDIQTDHLISTRRPDLTIINKNRELAKMWTLLFRLTTEQNWKKVKRRTNTMTFFGNWKNLWNMKATVIPFAIGALVRVSMGLVNVLEDMKLRGRIETIQTISFFRSARILRRVVETWEEWLTPKILWKTVS